MYSSSANILHWLSSSQETLPSAPQESVAFLATATKRKAVDYPSPEHTVFHMDAPTTPPGKKRKTDTGAEDAVENEPTPRPLVLRDDRLDSASSEHPSTNTNSITSDASLVSGKRRRGTVLTLANNAVPEPVSINDFRFAPPSLLWAFILELKQINDRKGFVWPKLLDMIEALDSGQKRAFQMLAAPDSSWFSTLQDADKADGGVPAGARQAGQSSKYAIMPLGPCPNTKELVDILKEAQNCEYRLHCEANWNCAVHYPLLKLALFYREESLEFSNCTSATILFKYSPSAPSMSKATREAKKVDFCITLLEGSTNDELNKLVSRFKEPINHIAHDPYSRTPIAVSIETKGPKPDEAEARLQLAIWLSAQLLRLRELVHRRWQDPDRAWMIAREELGFLPAVMILGHQWFFVAAAYATGGELKLWTKVPLGTTETPEGICQIIYCIRRLAKWAEEFYWPWFKKWILGITPTPSQPTSTS